MDVLFITILLSVVMFPLAALLIYVIYRAARPTSDDDLKEWG